MIAYPVKMTFKILALAPQIYITDANGQDLLYVRQQLFRLKEKIDVYRDSKQSEQLFQIQADRIIDWSAKYHIRDTSGNEICYIQRHGTKSLWRAHYEIYINNESRFVVREESALTKFFDGLVGEIPVVGFFTGYLFNPKYNVMDHQGRMVMQIVKRPSLLERNFWCELRDPNVDQLDQLRILLSILMVALLERQRG
jgi:uncharacterized protein YxjI